jgi:hypothetical protein
MVNRKSSEGFLVNHMTVDYWLTKGLVGKMKVQEGSSGENEQK